MNASSSNGNAARSVNDQAQPRLRHMHTLWHLLGPLLGLAAVVIFFGMADRFFAEGNFLSAQNLRTVTVQTCVVAVGALGMTLIIIAGGIDLSAGTALTLCATVLAWGIREDVYFLVRHGDNFSSASQRLAAAQEAYLRAQNEGKSPQELSALRDAAERQRQHVLAIARQKLSVAEAALKSASAEDAREAWRTRVASLEGKIRKLSDPDFQLRVMPLWTARVPNARGTVVLAILLAISAGIATGMLNGVLISALKVVPFIVTLGTMTIYLGTAKWIADGTTVRPHADQVPDWLSGLVSMRSESQYAGFPLGVWLVVAMAILLALVLRYSVFSRHVFALGSNEATARLCGIHVPRLKVLVYSLAGLFIGIAALYQFSRLSVGNPTSGTGLELKIIAAVVIGGGSLNGGQGTVLGTLAGALIMQVIASGCNSLGLSNSLQDIINGVVIVAAVTIDQLRQRRL